MEVESLQLSGLLIESLLQLQLKMEMFACGMLLREVASHFTQLKDKIHTIISQEFITLLHGHLMGDILHLVITIVLYVYWMFQIIL